MAMTTTKYHDFHNEQDYMQLENDYNQDDDYDYNHAYDYNAVNNNYKWKWHQLKPNQFFGSFCNDSFKMYLFVFL